MVRLKRIPAVRAATLLTLTLAVPQGILLLLVLFLWMPVTSGGVGPTNSSTAFLTFAFSLATVWISIAIGCAVYNLLADRFGGIELEFETPPLSP